MKKSKSICVKDMQVVLFYYWDEARFKYWVFKFQNVCPCSSHHLPQAGPHRRQERQARPYVPGIAETELYTFIIITGLQEYYYSSINISDRKGP